MLTFTELASDHPLNKQMDLQSNGSIKKTPSAKVCSAQARTLQIPKSEFPKYLQTLPQHCALILGIWAQNEFETYDITLKGKESPQDGLISRSKSFFSYAHNSTSLMLFDIDKDTQHPYTIQDINRFFALLETSLSDALMGNKRHTTLCRFIRVSPSGEGWHIFVPVWNMSEELLELIFRLAWLNGFTSHLITRSGLILPRSIIDQAVAGPERLVFEADNTSSTLSLPERPCIYTPGATLDSEIACGVLRALTMPYEKAWQVRKQELESTEDVKVARQSFIDRHTDMFGGKRLASRILNQRLNYTLLSSDFIIRDDNTNIPIQKILLNPETYDGISDLRDPLDPDYGTSKCKLFCTQERSTLHSFAHGSHTFTLKFDFTGLSEWVESADVLTLREDCTEKILQSELSTIESEAILRDIAKRLKIKQSAIVKDVTTHKDADTLLNKDATHDEIALTLFRTYGEDFKLFAGSLYSFESTLWQKTSREFLQGQVGKLFSHCTLCKIHSHYKGVVAHGFETLEAHKITRWKSQYGFPCSDGFHKVYLEGPNKGVKLEPYTKEHGARFKMGFKPDFEMETPYWNRVLANVVNPRAFQQAVGLILAGMMTAVLQSAMVLKGPGGTGKGTTATVMRAMLPKGRVTAVEIKDMSTPEVVVSLADSVVNFAPEISPGSKNVINTEGFKSLIGCDEVRMRQLYSQSNFFVSTAAHVISLNSWPTLDSSDSSIRRRLGDFIIEFQKNHDERIMNLGDRIVEREIAGVLAWAITGVEDYIQNGPDTEHSHELFESWVNSFDSIERFLNDCTEKGARREFMVSQSELYPAYKKYCEDSRYTPKNKGIFFARLEEDRSLERFKSGVMKYKGIRLKNSKL